ncbi:DUF4265 domain-containing protein [Microbispora sp. ZYX-F-249]|uniref:DUF4265 domain-containing protein n=1 Tax=Microbispora maris TaxID=3144104 RepID=A0ABV0AG72_9ACTN
MVSSSSESTTMVADDRVKVWYRFVPREGWPQFDQEGVWATPLGGDLAQVDNVPFFVDGAAEGDIVRFTTDAEGVRWVEERVEWSGWCTILVLPVRGGPKPTAEAVCEVFAPLGIGGEAYSAEFPLVALSVPPDADVRATKALLDRGVKAGWWNYQEACIGDAWPTA